MKERPASGSPMAGGEVKTLAGAAELDRSLRCCHSLEDLRGGAKRQRLLQHHLWIPVVLPNPILQWAASSRVRSASIPRNRLRSLSQRSMSPYSRPANLRLRKVDRSRLLAPGEIGPFQS